MEVSTHKNRHRKRDAAIDLSESTAQPPEKSVKREEGGFDPSHQQQDASAAVAPPQHTTAPTATAAGRVRVSSFSMEMILAGTGTDETPSSSLMMAPSENLESPESPPQTELDQYSINSPYGAVHEVQYRLRVVDTEAPYSGFSSAINGNSEDPRFARILSATNVHADVIDVSDDEDERQSAVSSVEKETEPCCSADVKLRQKLITVKRHKLDLEQQMLNMDQQLAIKEDMLQRERRAKQGAEERADQAEKLLKSQCDRGELKHNELLNMQKELAMKEEMLQSERRAKEEAESRADEAEKLLKSQDPHRDELNWRNKDLIEKSEMEKRMNELKEKMEKKEKRAIESISDLKRQLEKEKRRHHESVDELKHKLAEYENTKLVQSVMNRKINPRIDKRADLNSIIRLLHSRSSQAMSIDEAVKRVRAAFRKCGERAKKICEDKGMCCTCDPCGIEMHNMLTATTHFLSEEHIEKVRSHHACVSELAVMRWVDELYRNK